MIYLTFTNCVISHRSCFSLWWGRKEMSCWFSNLRTGGRKMLLLFLVPDCRMAMRKRAQGSEAVPCRCRRRERISEKSAKSFSHFRNSKAENAVFLLLFHLFLYKSILGMTPPHAPPRIASCAVLIFLECGCDA